MEGAIQAAREKHNLAIVSAWFTAKFALDGYGGHLKGRKLSDYLIGDQPRRPSHANAIAFFNTLKAQGFDVKITRETLN